MSELLKLPLWRSCVEHMLSEGVHNGKAYPVEYFEERLRGVRGTVQFNTALHSVRTALENSGFYISSRGHNGTQYVILSADVTANQYNNHERTGARYFRRALTLGSNIDRAALSDNKRRKLESNLAKTAIRYALITRSAQAAQVISKIRPQLLNRKAPK